MSFHLLPIGITPTPGVTPLLMEVANDLLVFLMDVRFSELAARAPPTYFERCLRLGAGQGRHISSISPFLFLSIIFLHLLLVFPWSQASTQNILSPFSTSCSSSLEVWPRWGPGRKFREPYINEKDEEIVGYFCQKGGYSRRRSNTDWQKMERHGVCPGRTRGRLQQRWKSQTYFLHFSFSLSLHLLLAF